MPVRFALLVACVVALVVLAGRRSDARSCAAARSAVFRSVASGQAGSGAVDRVREDCHDPDELAVTAAGLARTNPRAAAALARIAVRRAPDAFGGWAALAIALRRTDPEGSARAARRAHSLNPRWTAP